eukprot:768566-Hanusia_phi.AAC.6
MQRALDAAHARVKAVVVLRASESVKDKEQIRNNTEWEQDRLTEEWHGGEKDWIRDVSTRGMGE